MDPSTAKLAPVGNCPDASSGMLGGISGRPSAWADDEIDVRVQCTWPVNTEIYRVVAMHMRTCWVIVCTLTVEIDDDTAVGDAAGGAVEVGHAIRELLDRGRVVAGRECEVAGVDDGVAEGEDALVAAAEARRRVEEEDNGDEELDGAPHLTDDLKHHYYFQGAVWLNTVSFYDLILGLCTPDLSS